MTQDVVEIPMYEITTPSNASLEVEKTITKFQNKQKLRNDCSDEQPMKIILAN